MGQIATSLAHGTTPGAIALLVMVHEPSTFSDRDRLADELGAISGVEVHVHKRIPSMIVHADQPTWDELRAVGGPLDHPDVEVVENEPMSYPPPR